ncbi:PID-CTERM protein-sorting domain-containing protein [Algibacter sp. R77976]|uniref:PID-CTERM protein-sorting domain-containing protein n=1 Tax=Algibacter sp. R77976 TaxID=3093873 RepID=UPI0037C7645F
MKNKRNTFFKTIFSMIVVFAIICTTNLNAQTPPGGGTDTIDSLPLDGGLIALLIGAVAFGVKKLYNNKQ